MGGTFDTNTCQTVETQKTKPHLKVTQGPSIIWRHIIQKNTVQNFDTHVWTQDTDHINIQWILGTHNSNKGGHMTQVISEHWGHKTMVLS